MKKIILTITAIVAISSATSYAADYQCLCVINKCGGNNYLSGIYGKRRYIDTNDVQYFLEDKYLNELNSDTITFSKESGWACTKSQ